jgi:DNA-binding GntR family transcriptional regulator
LGAAVWILYIVGMMGISKSLSKSPGTKRSIPIQRQSLASAVAERLREQIINGELHEGEQLRQDAVAKEFQVSRIPVREAFLHLEAEGLITTEANKGAVVSALSPEEIEELFETRAVLECHILRQAIPHLTKQDFAQAEKILKEYEQALEDEADVATWGQLNWQFHSTLYSPANRPMLLSLIKVLNNNCDRYTRLHLMITRNMHKAGKAHRAILTVCKGGNADKACQELSRHINDAGKYLKEFIRKRREEHEHAEVRS